MDLRTDTLIAGAAAGAAGKAALDLASYLDMLVRRRPASSVPAKVAERLMGATQARLGDLSGDEPQAPDWQHQGEQGEQGDQHQGEQGDQHQGEQPGPRERAVGAMSGYAIGLGLGMAYALVRARAGAVDAPRVAFGGIALAALAMASSDVPAVATGATTNPRDWPLSAWLADVLPHAAYGLVTALVTESLLGQPSAGANSR